MGKFVLTKYVLRFWKKKPLGKKGLEFFDPNFGEKHKHLIISSPGLPLIYIIGLTNVKTRDNNNWMTITGVSIDEILQAAVYELRIPFSESDIEVFIKTEENEKEHPDIFWEY